MPALHFSFAFDPIFQAAAAPFGVRPDRAAVTVDGERIEIRYGPWTVATRLANVAGAEVTGPYTWLKSMGPPRLSLVDRGLTFASNPRQGVCIRFREPVPGILPNALLRHPGVTVTVDDPPALAELLRELSEGEVDVSEPLEVDELVQEVTDDLHAMTAAELRERARELGIPNASKLKKAELIDALSPEQAAG